MAIETRARGGLYYYRARKQNGRTMKEYVGAGQAAIVAARGDEQERAERRAESDADRLALAVFEAEEAAIDDLCQRTERLAQAALLGAGYRRHDRGEWRRRR